MKTGDTVLHKPTGETWLVAYTDDANNRLAWCGWPQGLAKLSDCELIVECSAEESAALIRELAGMSSGNDPRKHWAMRRIAEPEATS